MVLSLFSGEVAGTIMTRDAVIKLPGWLPDLLEDEIRFHDIRRPAAAAWPSNRAYALSAWQRTRLALPPGSISGGRPAAATISSTFSGIAIYAGRDLSH